MGSYRLHIIIIISFCFRLIILSLASFRCRQSPASLQRTSRFTAVKREKYPHEIRHGSNWENIQE